jgi:integration host factor subunit alpha
MDPIGAHSHSRSRDNPELSRREWRTPAGHLILSNTAARFRLVHRGGEQMTKKTVTRTDLCGAVYHKVGLSRTESAAFVELVLKEITDCLERGETVKLSSFGSFIVRKKGRRVGRNPKTGMGAPIPPRRVMVFKPSEILKRRINLGSAPNGNEEIGLSDEVLRRQAG